MIRTIISIDEEKCDGCGLCVEACHEGAIGLVDGKARLLRDDYCDGLGDCLPACPTGAITFVEREAAAYNEEEVKKNMEQEMNEKKHDTLACGCPGSHMTTFAREGAEPKVAPSQATQVASHLAQWPIQIKLVPQNATYFEDANLLIAADCAAYAYGNFHNEFMRNKITLIGCPKLDEGDYTEKLTAIISNNTIRSVTVARMEVPCCGGIEQAVIQALRNSGKMIPWQVVTFTTDGRILE
ncbi:MAG: 4Fe-4S binding protein [Raoultibacter sp.]|jgi:ferredoxin